MAKEKTKKTAGSTKKAGASKKAGTKKSKTIEQINKLEKSLKNTKEEDIIELIPEEVKPDILTEKKAAETFENTEAIDIDAEVEKIMKDQEPSEEVKVQVEEFEKSKEEFNKKLEKNPEKTEALIKEELSQIEKIKKRVEVLKQNLDKGQKSSRDEGFTNWWNGSSSLY